jgi:hypothetical protein
VVPQRNGVVDAVDEKTITVLMDPDEERPAPRRQTFQLRGKTPYVSRGDRFVGQTSIIAGVPARRVEIRSYLRNHYDPITDVDSQNAVDRYAAVKSLPYLPGKKKESVAAIDRRLGIEKEERVLLEMAGAGTALESERAWDCLASFVWKQARADLRMEAVFILTELRSSGARELLLKIANDPTFSGDEIRQAAVWGLGKAGLKQYGDIVPFLGDKDRDVVLHAIAAFDADANEAVIDQLVGELVSGDVQRAPAASEALRVIGSDTALLALITAARQKKSSINWILATLGRLDANKVRMALKDDPLLDRLAPILLLSKGANWTAEDAVDIDLKFLLKQNL